MKHGLLVCFGYPVAYEDAAQRAIRTGLALLDDVAALTKRVKKTCGVTLSLRVGIHTGLAVAGDLSGGTSKVGEPRSRVIVKSCGRGELKKAVCLGRNWI